MKKFGKANQNNSLEFSYPIQNGLFTKTGVHIPDPVNKYFGESELLNYKLNFKKFNQLLILLEERNKVKKVQKELHQKISSLSDEYSEKFNFLETKLSSIHLKLQKKFYYFDFVTYKINADHLVPFFNLRYLQNVRDLNEWLKLVKLELEFCLIPIVPIRANKKERLNKAVVDFYFEWFDRFNKDHKKTLDLTLYTFPGFSKDYLLKLIQK
jgi:hypothetical protein